MGLPVATKKQGFICFAFPDVCQTPTPPSGQVPIPYPNLGQLADADQTAEAGGGRGAVRAGGAPLLLAGRSVVPSTTGDEAGTGGGVNGNPPGTRGKAEFPEGSATVYAHGCGLVRLGDSTRQNNGNARGTVLGGVSNVRAGG